MKAILKNFLFLLKRFKTASILNIIGLSVAFAIAIVVSIECYYNATYNRNFEKSDTIAQLTLRDLNEDNSNITFSMPFIKEMTDQYPEMKTNCILGWNPSLNVYVKDTNPSKVYIYLSPARATSGFFDVFTPKIIRGSTTNFDEGTDKIVITEKTATKLFGNENPIDKTIQLKDSDKTYTIIAVCEDFAKNSLLGESDGIVKLEFNSDKIEWSYRLYLNVENGTQEILTQKINDFIKAKDKESKRDRVFIINYLKDDYFKVSNNKTMFISLLALGIIVLMIAYINYVNISVAMIPSRIKAINIQKILGASRLKIRLMIICEGIGFAFIAFVISLLLIHLFSDTSLSQLFSADLNLSNNLNIIFILGILFLILIIIIGIYPSIYASSFPEAITLKGSYTLSKEGSKLRNVLIVVQFIAAISIASIAYFIKIQNEYMKNFSTGIQKENIVYLPLRNIKTDLKTFGDEIIKNPQVLNYTFSESFPGEVGMGWGRNFLEKNVSFTSWPVSQNFLDFFGIKIIAGDDFTTSRNDTLSPEQIIVNNRFLEKYNFTQEQVLKKDLYGFSDGIVQGIAGDVNFASVYYPIEPMAFVVLNGKYREKRFRFIFLKISDTNVESTIDYIKQTWYKYSDDDFELTFLDKKMNDMYKAESNVSLLISIFGLVTILITVMGLYGLIVFNAQYKKKEIAIRKVNGSSEKEIIVFLNKQTITLFLIGLALSIPLSYYVISKWLESFPYKAPIPAWLFIASGLLVFIISIATVSWQSWRAATNNPVESLKND